MTLRWRWPQWLWSGTGSSRKMYVRSLVLRTLAYTSNTFFKVLSILYLVKKMKVADGIRIASLLTSRCEDCPSHQCEPKGLRMGKEGRIEDERHGHLGRTWPNAAGLQMEEGTQSQGMQTLSGSWKRQGMDSPQCLREKTACQHLDFHPVRFVLDF